MLKNLWEIRTKFEICRLRGNRRLWFLFFFFLCRIWERTKLEHAPCSPYPFSPSAWSLLVTPGVAVVCHEKGVALLRAAVLATVRTTDVAYASFPLSRKWNNRLFSTTIFTGEGKRAFLSKSKSPGEQSRLLCVGFCWGLVGWLSGRRRRRVFLIYFLSPLPYFCGYPVCACVL